MFTNQCLVVGSCFTWLVAAAQKKLHMHPPAAENPGAAVRSKSDLLMNRVEQAVDVYSRPNEKDAEAGVRKKPTSQV